MEKSGRDDPLGTKAPMSVALEPMLTNPATVFDSPNAVLQRAGLTRHEKMTILAEWERDARALLVAADESMTGSNGEGGTLLAAIEKAQRMLGGECGPDGVATRSG